MNTTIIDKILIHMLDMEHSQILYSDQFIDLIEGTTEYYDKKIEKCLTPSLEVITIFFRTTFKSFLSICRFYRLFLYF